MIWNYRVRLFIAIACGFFIFAVSSVASAAGRDSRLIVASQQPVGQGSATSSSDSRQPKPYTLSPEKETQAIAYAHSRHELYFLDVFFTTIGLLILIEVRIGPKLRDWAEGTSRHRSLQALTFAVPFFIFLGLLNLPGGAAGHWLARYYGQSVQGWSSWFWDAVKGGAISLALAVILVWLFFGLVRRSPRRWWLYAWLGSLPILLFLIFLEPVVLEPMFFRFTPLAARDPQLVAALEKVVQHAGQRIPESRMYLMNASSKLTELNAYVTGIGASERVVVWDTTIAQMSTPQILFVFGHEMGHYVLHHVRDGILFTAGILFVFLCAAFNVLHWALRRFGETWKIRGIDDWASLPVFIFAMMIFSFVFTPIDNAFSRHLEHQADQYGLEVIHGIVPDAPQVAAQSFQIFGEADLAEPAPSRAVKIWFYDHPPLDERIVFAQTYDPWSKGELPQFVK